MSEIIGLDLKNSEYVAQLVSDLDIRLNADHYKDTTSDAVNELYREDVLTVLRVFVYCKPPAKEDSEALITSLKSLLSLVTDGHVDQSQMGIGTPGPSVSYPTKEMVYATLELLKSTAVSGFDINATDPASQLGAVAKWQNMSDTMVKGFDGKEVSLDAFVKSTPPTGASEPGLSAKVEAFVVDDLYESYMEKLEGLGDKTKQTEELIKLLTQLVDMGNLVTPGDVGDFHFPPENGEDIYKIYNILTEYFAEPGRGDTKVDGEFGDLIKNGELPWLGELSQPPFSKKPSGSGGYKDVTWHEAFEAAYQYDVQQAKREMEADPSLTFEEAMSHQHQASDVVNYYLADEAHADDAAQLMDILKDQYFVVVISLLEEEGVNPAELGQEVIDIYNKMQKGLEGIDTPYETNSLPYFLDKLCTDIVKFFGTDPNAIVNDPDALSKAFAEFVIDMIDPGSSTWQDLNNALNTAKYTNGQQKQELQVMMMEFQTLMGICSSIMESLNKSIESTAQKVGGH